jgi:Cu-Zn family superoxide dismutase
MNRYKQPFSFLLQSTILISMTSCACTDPNKPLSHKNDEIAEADAVMPNAKPATAIKQAVAEIRSFEEGNIQGKVTFTKVLEGVRVVADVKGLKPGEHGFHIHEKGDCSGNGEGVGEHFNPSNSQHGGPDSMMRHVGDLGNLVADEKGNAHYEKVNTLISFEGKNSIIGRSIVIHSDPDDYRTQPAGNSGKKIACGVIK